MLYIEFEGWCLIRLATDPDPAEEPRGVSGFTFAFAGEPDLDRVVRLQPPPPDGPVQPRSFSPPIGVAVTAATRRDGPASQPIDALAGAPVNLLGKPMLEQRNWILTRAAYEPIVPFDLTVTTDSIQLRRCSRLVAGPTEPAVWQVDRAALEAKGGRGIALEPETVSSATGIWDPLGAVQERRTALQAELDALPAGSGRSDEAAALRGRIAELGIGIDRKGRDRRVQALHAVEHFGFDLTGTCSVRADPDLVGGTLDRAAPWLINFWMGGWDADTMCAFMRGVLRVPYAI